MLNERIFYFFNSFAGNSNLVDSLIIFLANDVPWFLIIFTLVYFIFIKKNPRRLLIVFLVVATSAGVTAVCKWLIFQHPRPFLILPHVHQLINIYGFGSFPSQHATILAAIATAVFIYDRRIGAWLAILTLFVGLARIAAGIHFPIDILTGFAIGLTVTFLSYRLYHVFLKFLERSFS